MCIIAKVRAKIKILEFVTKMSDLGVFALEFENTIVIIEITTLKFASIHSLL